MRDHKGKPSAEHEAGYRALSEELRRQLRQPDGSVRGPAALVRRLAAAIEALAASIAAKGLLQSPVVEPETGEDGVGLGFGHICAVSMTFCAVPLP